MESSEGNIKGINKHPPSISSKSSEAARCNNKAASAGCVSGWRPMEAEAVRHYQAGKYSNAAECYTKCLQQTGIPSVSRISLLHGRSAANLKLKKYKLVLEDCHEILNLDSGNVKALARIVKALSGEGKFSEARVIALQWQGLDPRNDQVKKELERLNIILKALQEQDAEEDAIDDGIVLTGSREPPEGEEAEDDSASTPFVTPTVAAAAASGTAAPPSDNDEAAAAEGAASAMEDDDDLYHCKYCDVNFTSSTEFRMHCQSDQHQKIVSSDDGKEWKCRPPPRGLTGEEYSLCPRYFGEGSCRFGDRCSKAHSNEELKEWRERFEYRRERFQNAKDSEMMQGSSFAEQLLEKWMSAANPELILTDNAEGINIHVNADLSVTMTSKKSASSWTFTVTSKVCIKRIVLLDDANRRYFQLHSVTVGPKRAQKTQKIDECCQEWMNPSFIATRCNNEKVYRIKVVFKTDIYGTFRQSIVFDFGSEPMLVRELCVDSSPVIDIERLQQDLKLNEEGRWDLSAKNTVAFLPRPRTLDESDQALLAKFPPPMAAKFTISEAMLTPELKKEAYKQRMHDLLYIEEMAQFSSIAKFNIRTSLHLVNRFLLTPSTVSTAKFAQGGELFARMKLNSDLSEDTSQGRLVLQNVSTVYMAPYEETAEGETNTNEPKTVYEALVEEKGKNFIFLRLSAKCVQELALFTDTEIAVEVQFQLNRLPLCEMHEAMDLLPNLDVVFPAITSADAQIPWNPVKQWNGNHDVRLNIKQKEAIVAITTDIKQHLPPTLIVGPYGTGKTYTLAHAARCLLEDPVNRILICTHSNSAADLYVKDYFDPYVKDGHPDAKPLRVYYRHRWVQTVNPIVLDYCLVSMEANMGAMFRKPTQEDINNHRVIVCTLSTSRYLFSLGLEEGFFTHILLDEAAQAQECETVMPLVLAGPNTRVVLAGDHMQLGPEIHSDFAREREMHISFLERLYDHYPENHSCRILLCENYRSHIAIINYTSELFYNKKLVASGKQPHHHIFYPLTFFTARGEDMQHQNSTAFYNNSEVYEIVERVVELQKTWPKSWGTLDETSIGVVSPYYDQVIRIRAELRKKKLFSVSVERVLNVQGKQFRAIFLSTVRTRNTCSSDISLEDFMDYGFLSNVKLLNTAITRSQSLVAVVGDPVSLCSVGKCRKLWERFIEICHENTSLYGITWTQLRAQLDGVELKKTYVLNPNAPEFIPNRLRHGPFAPLEPVAMGRYGYTFVPQPQPPRGIMTVPPPWQPKHPFSPPFKHPEMYYRSGRCPLYPVPAMTAYMTPMVKVTGSPVHLPGGVPTSLSMPPPTLTMAALKAGSPVVQGKAQGKETTEPKKLDGVTSLSPVSDTSARAGLISPLQSPRHPSERGTSASKVISPPATAVPAVPAVHVGPPFSMSQMPMRPVGGFYRMAYKPAYPGMPPFSSHFPMGSPYGVFYPQSFAMKPPPTLPANQVLPQQVLMKPGPAQSFKGVPTPPLEGGASGGASSPYQFLPNACNTQSEPPSAGAAMSPDSSQGTEKLSPLVKRIVGQDNQALLNNPFLQRELYRYIHQAEGEEGVLAFMHYIQEQQMKGQPINDHTDPGSRPVSPRPPSNSSINKRKTKKEVVSVRRHSEDSPFSDGRSHSSPESAHNGYDSETGQVESQIASWHNFDATSPPFSKLAGNFRKAMGASRHEQGRETQRMSYSSHVRKNSWTGNDQPQHESSAPQDAGKYEASGNDFGQPAAVSDMMKFLEDITDDEVRDPEHQNSDRQAGVVPDSGAFPSTRPGPLYMRGAAVATSAQSPPAQTTLSYAGALRSQLTTTSEAQPKSTLTPAQEASRLHLMSLLRCGANNAGGPGAVGTTTTSSASTSANHPINSQWQHPYRRPPVLPHPENPLIDQAAANDSATGSREIPANPLDLLKNLHIKASPGTQALYQYFS